MKISLGINPNCSEATFRFYVRDPAVMEKVLRAFAECSSQRLDIHLTKPEDVNKVTWPACNWDAECFFEPHLDAFVLRVGNNDLSDSVDNGNGQAIELVKSLGIPVEEAEFSPVLDAKYSRDCCCGIVWFDGYKKLLKAPPAPKAPGD